MGFRASAERLVGPLALWAALLPAPASAQVYCCDDASGHQVCADVLPRQCYGKAYRILSAQGSLLREVEAPLTRDELKARREAERERRAEQDRIRSQKLKERALLETYRDLDDIDKLEARAIAEVEVDMAKARKLESELMREKARLTREKEFYATSPMPPDLAKAVTDNEQEILAQQSVIEAKKQLLEAIRQRYAADREAYKVIIDRRETLYRR